jgi:hypothetical protein
VSLLAVAAALSACGATTGALTVRRAPVTTTSTTRVAPFVNPHPPPPPTTTTTAGPVVAAAYRCQATQLRLTVGEVGEKTEQHSLLVMMANEGPGPCYLFGYPGISLYDSAGQPLDLSYRWGGDEMITASPPSRVSLAVGSTAFVVVNENECGTPEAAVATTLRLIPPDDTSSDTVDISGVGGLVSCTDAGWPLDISPVERSQAAAFAPVQAGP